MNDPHATQADRARKKHRQTWGIVLVIGVVLIAVMNWSSLFNSTAEPDGISLGRAWMVAGLLIVFMLIHGGIAWREDAVPNETKADGFYYLGLLFTFASLVPALVGFALAADAQADVTGIVIANFGIALVTTIVGLGGRVLFTMEQQGPGDDVALAHDALADAIQRMKDKLLLGVDDTERLVGQLRLSSVALSKTAKEIERTAESASNTANAVEEHSGRIADSGEPLSSGVEDFKKAVDAINDDVRGFRDALAGARGAITTFGEGHAGLGGTVDAATIRVRQVGDAAQVTESELRRLRSSMASLNDGIGGVERFSESVAGATSAFDEAAMQAKAAAGSGAEAAASARAFGDGFSDLSEAMAGVRKGVEELKVALGEIQPLMAATQRARQEMAAMEGISRQVNQDAAATQVEVRTLTAGMNELHEQAIKAGEALRNVEAAIDVIGENRPAVLRWVFGLWRK